MSWIFLILVLLASIVTAMWVWRRLDELVEQKLCHTLLSSRRTGVFDPSILDDLPMAARKYLQFMIKPGTPLSGQLELHMHGEICLGSKQKHTCLPMQASQTISAWRGFVWSVKAGRFPATISGSDGLLDCQSWTRFWLAGTAPIARVTRNEDHLRSSFGRLVAECAMWVPSAFLDVEHVSWLDRGADIACAVVRVGDLEQEVSITLAADGAPKRVNIQRWSNENLSRQFQAQPFGGYVSDFRQFDGYMIPTRVEGGNWIDTDDYFAFFKADIDRAKFV